MKKIVLGILVAFLSQGASGYTVIKGKNGKNYHTGYLHSVKQNPHGKLYFNFENAKTSLPDEYDSRKEGFVAPIKNQGNCGSCWAFSMTKTFESQRMVKGKPYVDFAEQDVLVNDKKAYGCQGGFMDAHYFVDHGVALETDCPYKASGRYSCNAKPADKAVSWAFVGAEGRKPTVDELKAAIFNYKVISVTVAAGSGWGGSGSVMSYCRNRSINHMVNIVGWNKQGWIMANSWGESWGDKGFMVMPQGCDLIASTSDSALFITYEKGPCVVPKVMLPKEVSIVKGGELMLGVKPQAGVTYMWSTGETDSMIYVSPMADTTYKLTAKSDCGTAESSVLVKVVAIQ